MVVGGGTVVVVGGIVVVVGAFVVVVGPFESPSQTSTPLKVIEVTLGVLPGLKSIKNLKITWLQSLDFNDAIS